MKQDTARGVTGVGGGFRHQGRKTTNRTLVPNGIKVRDVVRNDAQVLRLRVQAGYTGNHCTKKAHFSSPALTGC